LAALAVGCYRHDRRESRTLDHIHRSIDAVIAEEYQGDAFVTGQIGRLDVDTGMLHWVNAGHPAPLLVRHGQVVGSLERPPALPWGFGPRECAVYIDELEPRDSVLFYTDGITDGRRGREGFGLERLIDVVGQHASDELSIALIVRRVVRAVVEHHDGTLSDDATLLMINWSGPGDPLVTGGSFSGTVLGG
jgi:serine phosphatase RsbU (regulator of sigma subunit)